MSSWRDWSGRNRKPALRNAPLTPEGRRRTISRLFVQLGLNQRKFIDPNGETNREPQKIIAERPGHMVHLDVKKAGRIPDGGGWRVHGKGSDIARASYS